MALLVKVKRELGCRVPKMFISIDVSEVADAAGVIQSAFLARQSYLVSALMLATSHQHKKPQFLSPGQMDNFVAKYRTGNRVLICERGSCFDYDNLVADFRGLAIKRGLSGVPLVSDVAHALQERVPVSACPRGRCQRTLELEASIAIGQMVCPRYHSAAKAICYGSGALPRGLRKVNISAFGN